MAFSMRYFFLLLLLAALPARSQSITAYQLLPANATASHNLKLVLTVFHGGCGGNFGYSVVRSGNALAITGCYPAVAIAMPCVTSDTVQVGPLPAGTYSVTTTSHVAPTAAECPGSTLISPGPPNATGSFTVGLALASGAGAPARWQVAPTVLPATATTLYLTDAPALRQVSVYDLTGREKLHLEASALVAQQGLVQVQLPPLAPAIYLLRVVDASGQTSIRRFVRQ